MLLNISLKSELFEIEEKRNNYIDFEAIERYEVDPMTDIIYQNVNEKFKSSFYGKMFKPHFFEKSGENNKSNFENNVFCYSFLVVVFFNISDLEKGNELYDFAQSFEDVTDFDEVTFSIEFRSKDSDMTKVEFQKLFCDISNYGTKKNWDLSELYSYDELIHYFDSKRSKKWCRNIKDKVFNFIYSNHPVVLENNIDIGKYRDNYEGLTQVINDCLLVKDMVNY